MSMTSLKRIISGGQTGVDRAGLDVAFDLGIPCGGWCPKGRRAVDGPIPDKYPLKEIEAENYNKRTQLNVQDSDGTLVFYRGELEGGTAYTVKLADQYGKPCLLVDVESPVSAAEFWSWIDTHKIEVLNVAGPREEGRPGIYQQAYKLLKTYLSK